MIIFYTRRGLGGRGPLCGTGVISRIELIAIPFEVNARTEDSRPEPTPEIITSISFIPMVPARSANISPTLLAANGVPFFAPLKPKDPLEDQARVLPEVSV